MNNFRFMKKDKHAGAHLYAQMLLSTYNTRMIYVNMKMIGAEAPTELLQDHAHQDQDHRFIVKQTSVISSSREQMTETNEKEKEQIQPFDVAFVGDVVHSTTFFPIPCATKQHPLSELIWSIVVSVSLVSKIWYRTLYNLCTLCLRQITFLRLIQLAMACHIVRKSYSTKVRPHRSWI